MIKEIEELYSIFNSIKKRGWIEGTIKGYSDVGKTFEKLIGVNDNTFEIPDYKNIEIKTKQSKNNLYSTLFNCKPDGPYYMETERLKDTYGYSDRNMPKYKVLNNSVFCNEYVIIGNRYKFKLEINKEEKRIYLGIYSLKKELIEKSTYWDFDTLEEKLYRKMNLLAYVHAIKKYIKGKTYFKYTDINFYKLKSFNNFIDALEKGKIRVTFKVGIYKSGNKLGKTYDHGTGFDIKEEDLLELYEQIYI